MATTQYRTFPFQNGIYFKKFDVISQGSSYLYATQDNVNENPASVFSYTGVSWSRESDKTTVYYTKTGSGPNLVQGSLVLVGNGTDTSVNYTGMVLDAQSNYIQYINPGYTTTGALVGSLITSIVNPAWTSGFFFMPSYGSSAETKTEILESKFGDGYSQTQRRGLNSNKNSINLMFENRNDIETKAILNFVQDKGGVEPFKLLSATTIVTNDPNQKFTLVDPKTNPTSYNLNSVSVVATQNFSP
jgi:phage-related protein